MILVISLLLFMYLVPFAVVMVLTAKGKRISLKVRLGWKILQYPCKGTLMC